MKTNNLTYLNISEVKEFMDMKGMDKSNKTLESYALALQKFFDFLAIKSFNDIATSTPLDGRNFQKRLLDNHVSKNSVNAYVRPLKTAYNFWLENEYIENNPFTKVKALKTDKKLPVFLSEAEIVAMINACEKLEEKLIFTLLITTGLRCDELINLKLKDIDENHLIVHHTKGMKERKLLIVPEVDDMLVEYIEWRNKKYGSSTEYILVSKMGSRYSSTAIRDKIKKIARLAEFSEERIAQISIHSERHTYAANMIEAGADLKVLQEGLGHSNYNTTASIYAHVRTSALDNAVMNMKSYLVSK